jgi:hypothetical protein
MVRLCPECQGTSQFRAEDLSKSVARNGTTDGPRNPLAIANKRGSFATSETARCFIR